MNYHFLFLGILNMDHFYPKNQKKNPYSIIFLPSISFNTILIYKNILHPD